MKWVIKPARLFTTIIYMEGEVEKNIFGIYTTVGGNVKYYVSKTSKDLHYWDEEIEFDDFDSAMKQLRKMIPRRVFNRLQTELMFVRMGVYGD